MMTLGDINIGLQELTSLTTRAATQFGRGLAREGGTLMREVGLKAEELMKVVVNQCIKPKSMKPNISTGVKGSKRTIDLAVELEQVTLKIEVKTKIPLAGEALKRVRKQVQEAESTLLKNEKLIVVGANERPSAARLASVVKSLKKYEQNQGTVYVFNGAIEFLVWVGENYGEICLGL